MGRTFVEIAGRRLPLSNLEKDLYPSYGFTKAGILHYYRTIAPFILPHLKDRALTLKRYPEGVERDHFFEKRCPSHRPSWVKIAEIPQHHEGSIAFCVVNDLETLIWVANLASLELHVPLARTSSPDTPDAVVFDLDPGEDANIIHCSRVAIILRDLLLHMGLATYVKTSGNKGLHVFVPLNGRTATFNDTKIFSRMVAETLQKHYPDLVTAKMAKEERKTKVFINWSQNDASKTMICVYSLRARGKPFVSFPLEWKELERVAALGDPDGLQVLQAEAQTRVLEHGDLFQKVLMKEQRLPHL